MWLDLLLTLPEIQVNQPDRKDGPDILSKLWGFEIGEIGITVPAYKLLNCFILDVLNFIF